MIYLIFPNGIELTTEIPEVFKGSNINYTYNNGMTFIVCSDGDTCVYPIIHDKKALYILNGATEAFKQYYIDQDNRELVIVKNIVSPKIRNSVCFQLVTIPTAKYQSIVENHKISIRIKYAYLNGQSTFLEYNFQSKASTVISSTLIGK
jgi:hypothetical protein